MLIQRLSKISELVNLTCYYKYFWCCTHTDTTPIRCFMLVFTIYACIISTVNSYNNFFIIILSNFSPNLVKINFAKFHRFLLPIWISSFANMDLIQNQLFIELPLKLPKLDFVFSCKIGDSGIYNRERKQIRNVLYCQPRT